MWLGRWRADRAASMSGRDSWTAAVEGAMTAWDGRAAGVRTLMVDAVIAASIGALMVVGSDGAARNQVPPRHALDALAYTLVLVAALGLVVRRRWPLVAVATTGGATTIYLSFEYPYGPIFFAAALAMLTAAIRLPVRRSLIACGATILAVFSAQLVSARSDLTFAEGLSAAWVVWLLVPWAVGVAVQARREAAARVLEEIRGRYAYEQRLQIAREVHDVVGHGLAVINMQAGIALHVLDKRPEQAAVALDAIKRTSKDALEELRATLAVYRAPADLTTDGASPDGPSHGASTRGRPSRTSSARRSPDDGTPAGGTPPGISPDGGSPASGSPAGRSRDGGSSSPKATTSHGDLDTAPRRPPPGLGQLDGLVAATARSGVGVDLVVTGEPGDLPASVDLTAYRIVQESLTNVLRHAGPTSATVRVAYEPGAVVVEVTDDGSARIGDAPLKPGHGITGMRERAAAVGGVLETGPRAEGGFAVRARLPVAE
jgi:signal transduction histidine kinase